MLWVHATLVYASISAYQRFEERLSRANRRATTARWRSSPSSSAPPPSVSRDARRLRRYFAARIESAEIVVTHRAAGSAA